MEKLKAGLQKLGLPITEKQIEMFNTYYQELVDWNRKVNLTSITGYEEVQIGHFLDSLTVMLVFKPREVKGNFSIIDVGTGAGLPGIPIKILMPDIRLVLLEATAKKTKFLEHLNTRLGLDNVEVITGRAEEVAHKAQYREKFHLVLSRAVAPLPVLAELTLPFCVVGGSFIAQKKGGINEEINNAFPAIRELGGNLREVKKVDLEEFGDKRCLVVIDKVKPVPLRYPRRPGMPAKRPIM